MTDFRLINKMDDAAMEQRNDHQEFPTSWRGQWDWRQWTLGARWGDDPMTWGYRNWNFRLYAGPFTLWYRRCIQDSYRKVSR